jgi:ubiquinone/menaquinone biosynthesis C-methylase UbiE
MKTASLSTFDEKKSQAFAQQMIGHFNGASLMLMTAVAHRTGLWDTMGGLSWATSEEIAKAAGLKERYVREALGAFVTGSMVDYDPETKQYRLPAEHAALLTRKASPSNMAVTAQWISVLGSVEDEIVACFKKGGGVPYEKYDRFHEVMAEESRQTVVLPLVGSVLPRISGLTEKLKRGIEVLDAGCGSGEALIEMAKHFPKSRFTGYDFNEEAVTRARRAAEAEGLTNIRFEKRDAAKDAGDAKFDFITTFDAIHDQADPAVVLKNLNKALKDDGVYLMQEIAGSSHVHVDKEHPIGPFLYTISCMHCMTVSLEQNGAGLGAMWGKDTACRMLREAGFREIEVHQLEHDIINYFYVVRK